MYAFGALIVFCFSLGAMNSESLKQTVVNTIINNADLLSRAHTLNLDLQELIMRSVIIEKIKKPLFPLEITRPQKPITLNHKGVCGLEAITHTKQIISIGCDGKIAFCHEDSMHNCDLVDMDRSWYCARLQEDNRTLYLGGLSGDVGALRIQDQQPQDIFHAHDQAVNSLSFSPDGTQLITCSNDSLIKLWNLAEKSCAAVYAGHKRAVKNAFSLQAHQKIISGAADRTVRIWDLQTCKQEHLYQAVDNLNISRLAKHPEEHICVCGFNTGALSILDVRQESVSDFRAQHKGLISGLVCSADGNYIASSSWDGKVRLWDIRMMACSAILAFHQDWIQSITSLHNFKKIISGSRDGTVKMWDVSTILAIDAINNLKEAVSKAAVMQQEAPKSAQARLAMLERITKTNA